MRYPVRRANTLIPIATGQTILRRLFSVLCCTLILTACSSSDDQSADPVNPPEDQPGDPAIVRLVEEIKLAAAWPIQSLNQKLASGVDLTSDEQQCLDGFNTSLGETLTSINCTLPMVVNDSVLTVTTARFNSTDICQGAMNQNQVDGCELIQASLAFPIVWVTVETPTISAQQRIAQGIRPIAGTDIKFNMSEDGVLELTDTTEVTGSFNCRINIATLTLIAGDPATGNCLVEINRTADRLNELRSAQVQGVLR